MIELEGEKSTEREGELERIERGIERISRKGNSILFHMIFHPFTSSLFIRIASC